MLKYFTPLWSKYVIIYSQVIKNTAKLIFKSLIDWDVAIDKLVTLRKFNVNKLYPTLKEKVDHNVQYKSTAGSENSTDHSHSIESIQAYQALFMLNTIQNTYMYTRFKFVVFTLYCKWVFAHLNLKPKVIL